MGQRTSGRQRDALHGGPRAKVTETEEQTTDAVEEDRGTGKRSKKNAKPEKGDRNKSKKSKGKSAKTAEPAPRAEAEALGFIDDTGHDHGRIDDPESSAAFSRLVTEIEGLVELVDRHDPAVRRAVFDSYVTAVTEFGATARDLGAVTVVVGDDDDADESEVVAGRRRGPSTLEGPATGPVREAPGLRRAATAPRAAVRAAHGGRSGVDPIAGIGTDPDDAPGVLRRRSTPEQIDGTDQR